MSVSAVTNFGSFASSAGVTSSGPITATATVPLGALALITVGGAGSTGIYSVTDSQGHTWSSLTLWAQGTGTLMSTQVFYAKITTPLVSGVDTITVGRTASNSLTVECEYVTGQDPTTPIGNGGVTQNNSSSTSVTTLSAPASLSANAGDLTRSVLIVTGNSTGVSSTTTTNDANIVSTVTNTRRMVTASRLAAVTETPTPDWSWTTANAAAMGAYVIAAAPPVQTMTFVKTVTVG